MMMMMMNNKHTVINQPPRPPSPSPSPPPTSPSPSPLTSPPNLPAVIGTEPRPGLEIKLEIQNTNLSSSSSSSSSASASRRRRISSNLQSDTNNKTHSLHPTPSTSLPPLPPPSSSSNRTKSFLGSFNFYSNHHHRQSNLLNRLTQVLSPSTSTFIPSLTSSPSSSSSSTSPNPLSLSPSEKMIYSSLPPSTTNLNKHIGSHHPPTSFSHSTTILPSPPQTNHNRPASFWGSLSIRSKTVSKKKSSLTFSNSCSQIPTTPAHQTTAQQIEISPSFRGPSRVIAIVGNIRSGIGRMMVEELVRNKLIVVALIDKRDSSFSQSLEGLALSPSLFHAFPIPSLFGTGLLPQPWRPIQSTQLDEPVNSSSTTSPTSSTSPSSRPRSFKSFKPLRKRLDSQSPTVTTIDPDEHDPTGDRARSMAITEIKNVLKSYRVDTVICCFEPVSKDDSSRSNERRKDEEQPLVPPHIERGRIESMESTVLRACTSAGGVGRFATCAHASSPFHHSPLSTLPNSNPPLHLRSDGLPISLTEFRWGFLMNELASDQALADGLTAENGLGKWLCEPPKGPHGRYLIDFEKKTFFLPGGRNNGEKGKERVEPICFTLAEDVARFVALACKLKTEWKWDTGYMVGDKIKGGWEEVVEMLEYTSRTSYRREYHQKFNNTDTSRDSQSSVTASSRTSLEQYHPLSPVPIRSTGNPLCFDDVLRASLAKENLDASSVRLSEFFRVWFSPLPQPPTIVLDRRPSSHRQSLQSHQTRKQNRGLLSPPTPNIKSKPLSTKSITSKNPSSITKQNNSSTNFPTIASALANPISTPPSVITVNRDSYNFVPVLPFKFDQSQHLRNSANSTPTTSSPLAQKVS
ncbi:hypothetical protein CROQUDRAFT_652475 [Cronartium quercuum f. sp. fusiforme G11]|uniref:Uncharacterized protein n=1 Tax=Cronartium quercuum f. sp. fusiforme G11 TaxID=708437 RepID=A0A9P6TG14_9BASI|nr:hypothetical protein CROQUDRAFT_652475 [Cronartium quercuum f. sp. fusiforme G11]